MKRIVCILAFVFCATCTYAFVPGQNECRSSESDSVVPTQVFKGRFYCKETRVSLILDLYESSVKIPGYDFFGLTNGYMRGNTNADLYGIWMLTDFKIKDNTATLRFSNDMGSDSQTIELTAQADGTFRYKTKDGNEVRKAVKRKLVKIADTMTFIRQ